MKKIINLIIVTVLVFSLLTACSSKNDPVSEQEEVNITSNSSQGESSNNEDSASNSSQVELTNISTTTGFSNGLAFVKYNDDKNVYCIDKEGKELFALEGYNIHDFTKFNSKVAVLETNTIDEYVLCDKEGKVYRAEDFGATRIVLDTYNHQQAFLDGYIILERKEESYTGTKIEMSIIDSNFTTLVPFSIDLAEIINSDTMSINGTAYYDGYLYYEDTILDLRTGTQLSDRSQMKVSAPLLSYWSKNSYGNRFEHLEWGDIYNNLTGEVIAKVEESEHITSVTFVGNLGLAKYHTDNGVWFNVIAQDGTAKFEPIKSSSENILFDGETILIYDRCTIEKDGKTISAFNVKTYDTLGNLLGEIVLEDWSLGGSVSLNDGVILIYNMTTSEFSLYNSSLDELF